MRFDGMASWSVSVDQWDQLLEWALWFRAAERIEVPAGEMVTGPPEVDPVPEPSLTSGVPLVDGWLRWWRTLVARPSLTASSDRAELVRFSPPDFAGLADHPVLRDVVRARWNEADAWHSARKRAGIEAFRATRGPGREGAVVRAVEAEIGHKAAPFSVRIIVLPVHDRQIRSVGHSVFLVPESVYVSSAYDDWLRDLIRTLA